MSTQLVKMQERVHIYTFLHINVSLKVHNAIKAGKIKT